MHHAKIETSHRLQTLLTLLRQGGWWTTKDLMSETGSVAQATDISELRSNGFDIEARRETHRFTGSVKWKIIRRQVWSYRLHEVDSV